MCSSDINNELTDVNYSTATITAVSNMPMFSSDGLVFEPGTMWTIMELFKQTRCHQISTGKLIYALIKQIYTLYRFINNSLESATLFTAILTFILIRIEVRTYICEQICIFTTPLPSTNWNTIYEFYLYLQMHSSRPVIMDKVFFWNSGLVS